MAKSRTPAKSATRSPPKRTSPSPRKRTPSPKKRASPRKAPATSPRRTRLTTQSIGTISGTRKIPLRRFYVSPSKFGKPVSTLAKSASDAASIRMAGGSSNKAFVRPSRSADKGVMFRRRLSPNANGVRPLSKGKVFSSSASSDGESYRRHGSLKVPIRSRTPHHHAHHRRAVALY